MKNCPLPLPLRPLLLLALAGLPAPRVPGATILPLGDLPGGGFASQGIGISNDGGVVVGIASVGLFTSAAFRWTFDTGTVSLNGVPGSWPNGISSDGSVVAGNDGNAVFRWTLGGGNEEPAGIPQSSLAKDLSADGSTIVGASPGNVAFRWDPVGGLTSLGTLPGHAISRADGVLADGSVAVGLSYPAGTSSMQAFRWTATGGMIGLGFLPGFQRSEAAGVSGDGSVVVGVSSKDNGSYLEAFRWTESDGMQGLGDIPGVLGHSRARAVSDDGLVVVGTTADADNPFYAAAFVWTPDLGMISLDTLLVDLGVDTAEWTVLESVGDISANGRYLTGTGTRFGNSEAFRVDLGENWQAQFQSEVPEPATCAAGLALLGVMAARQWRARRTA